MNFLPIVDPGIWQRYPEYRALSVVVRDFQPADSAAIPILPLQPPVWMMEHLEAWRGAFRAFGANRKKNPRSGGGGVGGAGGRGGRGSLGPPGGWGGALGGLAPRGGGAGGGAVRYGSRCRAGNRASRYRRDCVAGRSRRHLPPVELAPMQTHGAESRQPESLVHHRSPAAHAHRGTHARRRGTGLGAGADLSGDRALDRSARAPFVTTSYWTLPLFSRSLRPGFRGAAPAARIAQSLAERFTLLRSHFLPLFHHAAAPFLVIAMPPTESSNQNPRQDQQTGRLRKGDRPTTENRRCQPVPQIHHYKAEERHCRHPRRGDQGELHSSSQPFLSHISRPHGFRYSS